LSDSGILGHHLDPFGSRSHRLHAHSTRSFMWFDKTVINLNELCISRR